jgi:hypothetical protein
MMLFSMEISKLIRKTQLINLRRFIFGIFIEKFLLNSPPRRGKKSNLG